eukprot:14382173-Ditylum_brightwellii.AAC.1
MGTQYHESKSEAMHNELMDFLTQGGVAGSVVEYLKSDDCNGALLEVAKLEGEQQEQLMKEVGKMLLSAGVTAQQLQLIEAFRGALSSFLQQEAVRYGVWRACLHDVSKQHRHKYVSNPH